MAGSAMSALWTLGCRQGRGGGAGCPHPGAGPPSLAWPFLAPVQEPGGRGSTSTEDHPDSAYSTREGIHWPRVVRTARMPHLPGVPPTLLQ